MNAILRLFAATLALTGALTVAAQANPTRAAARAAWLAQALDAMQVETRWLPGAPVSWRNGLPLADGRVSRGAGTHCSAFVAAAADLLGVYILRPPEHRQTLLANAQNAWLESEGADEGWRRLSGPAEAQAEANKGRLVVASWRNPNPRRSGHIAIVRPGTKNEAEIAANGPNVIQAGSTNANSISLRAAFAGHPRAWANEEIDFFAHAIEAPLPR